jgi:hypothetical protein
MLFDFQLRPLEEVQPWGKPPNLSLSWFGFTEGFYRLQIGSEFLLNYSEQFVEHQAEQSSNIYAGSFVDYYVVRLWEDILDMLPHILEPFPPKISKFFENHGNAWFEWESNALDWVDNQPDEDMAIEIFELAVSWQHARRLDTAYLQNAPRIWIWSTERDVIISWDNKKIEWEGIQVWSARQGHYSIKRNEFLYGVRAFHDKLMSEMAERVKNVGDRWCRSEIYVDIQQLKYEQQDRKMWLDRALKRSSFTSWDNVLSAIEMVKPA